jgi:hydroxymethylpyrimidine/phosphomethylpyrimidine kinase
VGSVGGKGFVQGIVTYTVMDDLTVAPMSSISSITLLNTFAVEDLNALQEKTVQHDCNEVIHHRFPLSSTFLFFYYGC